MRRFALPLALASVLALAALAGFQLLAGSADAPTRAEQAARLAAELRCPDCQALSAAESRTAAAAAIRAEIAEQLAAGRTPDEVRRSFVDRYGEWILLEPRDPLAWWLPVAALMAGAGLLVAWLRARRGGLGPPPAEPVIPDATRQRVRDEVEALDA